MKRVRILIVDDEAGICETLVDIFEAKGFDAVAVQSGAEGIVKIRRESFDVVLLDLMLPDVDGLEIFRSIREIQPDLICMFITGYASAQNAINALKHGASGYYIKPLVIDELLHGISEAMEKRSLRENLAESEARYRELLDASKDAIVSVDDHGIVFQWNQAATNIFGYTPDEIKGQSITKIIPERYHDGHIKGMERVRDDGTTHYSGYVIEIFGLNKSGMEVPLELSLSRWQTGSGMYFTGIIRDISERISLERQFRHAQKMEAIGTLAGGIAHDFNNLLSVINGYTEMARRAVSQDNEIYEDLTAVASAGRKATELVKQILTIARQSEGQEKKPLLLQSLLKETVKMLRGTIPTTIQFVIDINNRCRPVLADQTQIHQVLMNLATNAYHSMRESGGSLKISLDEAVDPRNIPGGKYLSLVIEDTGSGIDAHLLDRIFEPYFTTKKVDEGTGLGLATTHAIIQEHGGYISVNSIPGQGTRFEIFLPIINESFYELEEVEERIDITKFDGEVLLIDDDANIVSTLTKMLTVFGCGVESNSSSKSALEQFRANPGKFDLVITDYVMPEINGLKLASEIIKIRSDIPVIMITGFNENIDEGKTRTEGVKELLLKPIDMNLLSDTLKKYMRVVKEEAPV